MDARITVAVIGGVFGIVTPIITYFVTQAYNESGFIRLSKGRRKALDGKWVGTLHQEVGPDGRPLDADYTLRLSTSRKAVKGEGNSHFQLGDKKYESKFHVVGGFLHDRFLRFTYDNVDETTLQFGAMMLELDPNGRSLTGRFVAYGFLSKRLIYGTIELTKEM
jgi:hypothetical protein